jgi:hypothetical protein
MHLGSLEQPSLRLKGKSEPVTVRVVQIASD